MSTKKNDTHGHREGRLRSAFRALKEKRNAQSDALYHICRRKLPESQLPRSEGDTSPALRFRVEFNHIYTEEVIAATIKKFERKDWEARAVFDEQQPHVLKYMELTAPHNWPQLLLRR
jgi:hypothetical protein